MLLLKKCFSFLAGGRRCSVRGLVSVLKPCPQWCSGNADDKMGEMAECGVYENLWHLGHCKTAGIGFSDFVCSR